MGPPRSPCLLDGKLFLLSSCVLPEQDIQQFEQKIKEHGGKAHKRPMKGTTYNYIVCPEEKEGDWLKAPDKDKISQYSGENSSIELLDPISFGSLCSNSTSWSPVLFGLSELARKETGDYPERNEPSIKDTIIVSSNSSKDKLQWVIKNAQVFTDPIMRSDKMEQVQDPYEQVELPVIHWDHSTVLCCKIISTYDAV
ncbi:hypothetical protein FOXB_04419 [Fusarium oxysporum f. sp. conglutinans Fo5176]|uniref:BRCT domain-containing protein n=1 Tax=Fusarium oxysporum (strain Fo5176) TaxID=660025 RepID=F9FDE1_FUSOF|nr:hypothetical protein FOXB_04419 [Fusarium oxysporum f. sp. conglutinans Fo5176]